MLSKLNFNTDNPSLLSGQPISKKPADLQLSRQIKELNEQYLRREGSIASASSENPQAKQSKNKEWRNWQKGLVVALAALGVGALVKLKFSYSSTPSIPISNSLTNASNLGMMNFFNKYFPNVVVVGNINTDIGKETLRQLNHLRIKYITENPYDKSLVPPTVWTHLVSEIPEEERQALLNKMNSGEPLLPQETQSIKHLQGASACFLLHRKVILNTIQKYNEAIAKLEDIKTKNSFLAKQQEKKWEELRDKYSSIFIFEHNGRFGSVLENNSVDLSQYVGNEVKRTLEALPENWEYFSLFVNDIQPDADFPSENIPGTATATSKSPLVHPGMGMCTKGYGFSHRSYPDLEHLFSDVTEDKAQDFVPIDVAFLRLSRRQKEEGRLYHIAPTLSLMYRAEGESFHANASDPNSYAFRNLASTKFAKDGLTNA